MKYADKFNHATVTLIQVALVEYAAARDRDASRLYGEYPQRTGSDVRERKHMESQAAAAREAVLTIRAYTDRHGFPANPEVKP